MIFSDPRWLWGLVLLPVLLLLEWWAAVRGARGVTLGFCDLCEFCG